ncbi:hypothetical protein [Streptomyces mirabilis]|uniref:hypothetical protein n=1 Tax=Streptomyces mirabilis TaxID=68239 RepID=UPI00224DDDB4|nr:hypothetical protein [Streptomyces mirabilis]MCX4609493.1 hypothetical protein [Streptomyces mirabilis]
MTPERWERIARLLKDGPISNGEVSRRLGEDRRAVAGVRADLGLPEYVQPAAKQWTREDFEAMSIPLRGAHRRWRGRVQRDGTPVADGKLTAYRLAFRLHHDREPVGRVLGTCRMKRCVAGAHLEDDVLRAARDDGSSLTELPAGATWQGMDLVAIRRCLRGPAPWPPLSLPEARFAYRFSKPSMSAAELARRLGLCATTVERYRTKGVPSC